MGRVLDALQRQQENQETEGDPLIRAIEAPALVTEPDPPRFEMPERIGSPSAPRPRRATGDPSDVSRL